jgi:hypothetical protein
MLPRVGFSFLHVVLIVEKRTDSNSNIIFDPLKLTVLLTPWEYASPVKVLYSSIKPVNLVLPWMSKVMCIHSSNGGVDSESIRHQEQQTMTYSCSNAPRKKNTVLIVTLQSVTLMVLPVR